MKTKKKQIICKKEKPALCSKIEKKEKKEKKVIQTVNQRNENWKSRLSEMQNQQSNNHHKYFEKTLNQHLTNLLQMH